MNIEESISRLEMLVLAINDEVTRVGDSLPGAKLEIQGKLAARVAELAADVQLHDREEIIKQCAAVRVELGQIVDRHYGEVMKERQKIVGLDEIKHTLKAFASSAAAAAVREFSEGENSKLPAILKREFAALPLAQADEVTVNWATYYKGNYNSETTYAKGDVFAFGGGSYLVLKPSRGVLPSKQEQTGADPRYGVLSVAGSPGRNGNDILLPTLTTLTDGATITWDLQLPVAKVTLGGARTLVVTNIQAAQTYILHVIQPAAGSKTLTWPSSVKWPNDAVPTLTTTANYRDIFTFTTDGTYLFGNYAQGYTV